MFIIISNLLILFTQNHIKNYELPLIFQNKDNPDSKEFSSQQTQDKDKLRKVLKISAISFDRTNDIELKINSNYDYVDVFVNNKLIEHNLKTNIDLGNKIYINKESYDIDESATLKVIGHSSDGILTNEQEFKIPDLIVRDKLNAS